MWLFGHVDHDVAVAVEAAGRGPSRPRTPPSRSPSTPPRRAAGSAGRRRRPRCRQLNRSVDRARRDGLGQADVAARRRASARCRSRRTRCPSASGSSCDRSVVSLTIEPTRASDDGMIARSSSVAKHDGVIGLGPHRRHLGPGRDRDDVRLGRREPERDAGARGGRREQLHADQLEELDVAAVRAPG